MNAKTIIAGMLGTTLLATAAFAQDPGCDHQQRKHDVEVEHRLQLPAYGSVACVQADGPRRLQSGNEKLGDINELLIDKQR